MAVVDFSPVAVPILSGIPGRASEVIYPTPASEFRLSPVDLADGALDMTHSSIPNRWSSTTTLSSPRPFGRRRR